MKKLLLIFSVILFATHTSATKPEKELSKLCAGMSPKEVKTLYGDPSYSQFNKKANTRLFIYNFYKQEGGLAEYHIYFVNDSLSSLMLYKDKQEILQPLEKPWNEPEDETPMHYTTEGKCFVVSKIIDSIHFDNDQVRNAIIVAISRACNGSHGEIKVNESTRIVFHGIIDKIVTFDWRWGSINIVYSVDVSLKLDRVRVKVIGEEIEWNQDYDKAIYYFSDVFPIGNMRMKDVPDDKAREIIRNTSNAFQQYIAVIEEEILRIGNDDW